MIGTWPLASKFRNSVLLFILPFRYPRQEFVWYPWSGRVLNGIAGQPLINAPGFFRYCSLIASAAQHASVAIVPVGALALCCGNALPPTTNTLGTSHDCRYLLTALVAGSAPITAPPRL